MDFIKLITDNGLELNDIILFKYLDNKDSIEQIYISSESNIPVLLIWLNKDKVNNELEKYICSSEFNPDRSFYECAPYQLRSILAIKGIDESTVRKCGLFYRELKLDFDGSIQIRPFPVYWYLINDNIEQDTKFVMMCHIPMEHTTEWYDFNYRIIV